jgi:hypothetical protein
MKSAPDQTTIESAPSKRDSITADSIQARLMAGEIVGALDCPKADRPLFWAAIARVRDDLPAVKPTWRTIAQQHVDGIRTRQKMFRIFPRQKGVIDGTLAGLLALAGFCALLLAGGMLP